MAKTRRGYILATSLVSVAAAVLSFVTLGTEDWVTSAAINGDKNNAKQKDFVSVGLFTGVFRQTTAQLATYPLTMVCAYDLNICALLCGENMVTNLRKLYHDQKPSEADVAQCNFIRDSFDYHAPRKPLLGENNDKTYYTTVYDKVFINTGLWLSTIIFVVISATMGVVAAVLAVWNTASSPSQAPYNIFGLYVYNGIAFLSILLAVILWAVMYLKYLLKNIPTYKTFLEGFSTYGYARLGYSYWLNVGALFLYLVSLSLLYYRNYLIEKEPKRTKVPTDEPQADMYLR